MLQHIQLGFPAQYGALQTGARRADDEMNGNLFRLLVADRFDQWLDGFWQCPFLVR